MLTIKKGLGSVVAKPRVAYVASYPPRECGIATFTRDVVNAVEKFNPINRAQIVAMNDPGKNYDYPSSVRFQIERDLPFSYDEAADFVNNSRSEIVNIQHEYGLFGGTYGSYLFRFMDRVRQPITITLHTVLPDPATDLRAVTQGLIARSDRVVVLAQTALDILVQEYGADPSKLIFIPHGVPNVRPSRSKMAKRVLGLGDRPILATCGLMNPGKGIEYAIEAMSGLVREFPDALYLVVGETHPGVRATHGEAYREQLQDLVSRHGLGDHVRFLNQYLKYRDLVLYLLASDVYIVPYLDLNQIVSGTMAYAIGCGRAIISTPSNYAKEILADGRGMVVPARDPRGHPIGRGEPLA